MTVSATTRELTELLDLRWPIVQAGMVWVSGAKLAAASAKAGLLGVIGAGSMGPDLLRSQIRKARGLAADGAQPGKGRGSLAVNIPLLYRQAPEQIQVALDEGLRIFITSAGSPKLWTKELSSRGCVVLHVCSSPALALKCEEAGVHGVIAEGFEAGGHNGRDELTTMTLVPQVVDAVKIPVIAAGGIADGRGIVAALALGAAGVQIGTRFVATQESSAHQSFKAAVMAADPAATMLVMKKLVPVRLLKNRFYQQVASLEERCASSEELKELLGKGRAKLGMLDGDMDGGELEIGQISGLVRDCPSVSELVARWEQEIKQVLGRLAAFS